MEWFDLIGFGSLILRAFGVLSVILAIIFVHEMGHYLVGRWCGIGVSTFSLGFGPEIVGFYDKSGTRWRLALIPLGGYVKFVGDEDISSLPDGAAYQADTVAANAFAAANPWKRAATVFAGPLFNALFAVIVLTLLFFCNERTVVAPVVGGLQADMPAQAAGLQVNDKFISIDDQKINSFDELMSYVSLHSDDSLRFQVERDGYIFDRLITPKRIQRPDGLGNMIRLGAIGVYMPMEPNAPHRIDPQYVKNIQYDFGQAVHQALKQTKSIIMQTVNVVGRLIQGREDRCQLSGPTKTANIAWQVSEVGFVSLLHLAAILSISVGLINLLPVPPLDGGHLLFYLMEGVVGRPMPQKIQEMIFKIGMLCILAFMVFAVSNDYFPC